MRSGSVESQRNLDDSFTQYFVKCFIPPLFCDHNRVYKIAIVSVHFREFIEGYLVGIVDSLLHKQPSRPLSTYIIQYLFSRNPNRR